MPQNLAPQEVALLQAWLVRARLSAHSQHDAGKLCKRLGYALKVPSIVFPAAIGALALSYINVAMPEHIQILIACLGGASTICSVLDVLFRFSENAATHARLGSEYGIVRREIERLLNLGSKEGESTYLVIERLELRLNQLASEGPVVSTALFDRTRKRIGDKPSTPVEGI